MWILFTVLLSYPATYSIVHWIDPFDCALQPVFSTRDAGQCVRPTKSVGATSCFSPWQRYLGRVAVRVVQEVLERRQRRFLAWGVDTCLRRFCSTVLHDPRWTFHHCRSSATAEMMQTFIDEMKTSSCRSLFFSHQSTDIQCNAHN